MSVNPLQRKAGGAVVSHLNITSRKQADEAKRRAERRFDEVVDSLEAIVWRADARTCQFSFALSSGDSPGLPY